MVAAPLGWDGDLFGVPPQALEIVEGTGVGQEHVDDKVAVVLQDPLAIVVPLEADGQFAALLQLRVDLVADGLVLAGFEPLQITK